MKHIPKRLAGGVHPETRRLWEEIFSEDSAAFLDYYDAWKMKDNRCYGIYEEDRLISMLQLNPYELSARGVNFPSYYVIAVATDPAYRHKGLMTALLRKSMEDLREEGVPFLYLMPAAEEIYLPSGFRFFYQAGVMELGPLDAPGQLPKGIRVRSAKAEQIPEIMAFSEKVLQENFDLYTVRNRAYYDMLLPELSCEEGQLLLVYKEDSLLAVVPLWGGEETEIREILCRREDGEEVLKALAAWLSGPASVTGVSFEVREKKDTIMGRILCPERFLELFGDVLPEEALIRLEDAFLPVNSGFYRYTRDGVSVRAERLSEEPEGEVLSFDAPELFLYLLKGKRSFINEIV